MIGGWLLWYYQFHIHCYLFIPSRANQNFQLNISPLFDGLNVSLALRFLQWSSVVLISCHHMPYPFPLTCHDWNAVFIHSWMEHVYLNFAKFIFVRVLQIYFFITSFVFIMSERILFAKWIPKLKVVFLPTYCNLINYDYFYFF